MLKSMTGFGRHEESDEKHKIIVEMKSVNHRYCDISIKMPKKLNFFEVSVRNLLKEYIQRGKVDVFITYEDYTNSSVCVKYNREIAKEYWNYLKEIEEEFGIENNIKAEVLSKFPEVFVLEEQELDEQELWTLLEQGLRKAAERFVETRILEGNQLKKDILLKLDTMLKIVEFIEVRSPQIVEEYRIRLTEKVEELLKDVKIDQSILATEITLYADKICVDEETVRLKSHIQHMKQTLNDGSGIGRKLEFIAQEMNREATTILSKANDLALTNKAIDLKTDIEKVREQIQNIE